MSDFHIGDRVQIVTQELYYPTLNLTGTVAAISGYQVGVHHDEDFRGGHNLQGRLNNNRGLWYSNPSEQLRKIPSVILSDEDIDYLFS